MSNDIIGSIFKDTPPITKNLIIINVVMLLASMAFSQMYNWFSLFYPASPLFKPYQFLTHMFMHGNFWHLLFNMYALWFFGRMLEKVWGSQRFLLFYLVCGLGAAALYTLVHYFELSAAASHIDSNLIAQMKTSLADGKVLVNQDSYIAQWYSVMSTPMVGASGAIFGVLLGFGMLFPNTELQLLFPPVVLKAKWFVVIYGALELFLAIQQPGSNVAHAAHLGGMLFGFILIKLWGKKRNNFY